MKNIRFNPIHRIDLHIKIPMTSRFRVILSDRVRHVVQMHLLWSNKKFNVEILPKLIYRNVK